MASGGIDKNVVPGMPTKVDSNSSRLRPRRRCRVSLNDIYAMDVGTSMEDAKDGSTDADQLTELPFLMDASDLALINRQQRHTTYRGPQTPNYMLLLHALSHEHRFDVLYIDIDERTADDRYQCLVEMSMQPMAVVVGRGVTRQDAYKDAAHNAYLYSQYRKIGRFREL